MNTDMIDSPKRRGRPPAAPGDAKDARVELRLTETQRAKLECLGGAQWVRDRIDAARERQPAVENDGHKNFAQRTFQ